MKDAIYDNILQGLIDNGGDVEAVGDYIIGLLNEATSEYEEKFQKKEAADKLAARINAFFDEYYAAIPNEVTGEDIIQMCDSLMQLIEVAEEATKDLDKEKINRFLKSIGC